MKATVTNKGNTPASTRIENVMYIIQPGESVTFEDTKDGLTGEQKANAFVLDCTGSAVVKPVLEVK